MPYVDLYSADDYASIYYRTETLYGNVGGFDPELPTIMILPPLLMDSSWLDYQFGDPRLYKNYNIISFDMRCFGRSMCRTSPRHDSWVDAADLAFCVQKLQLPPCHVLAFEGIAVHSALRFCALFPEMCLSLTLCNVPPPTESPWMYAAWEELLYATNFARDIDTFDTAAAQSLQMLVGGEIDVDLRDQILEYWNEFLPPTLRHRTVEIFGVMMNRSPLTPETYASMTQPVLLIHSSNHEVFPAKEAENLQQQLVNSQGGAILYIIKGSVGSLAILPETASLTNQALAKFLARLPRTRSDIKSSSIPIEERMKIALTKLGEMYRDNNYKDRDPMSSLSFCSFTPEVIKRQSIFQKRFQTGRERALSPKGPDGTIGLKYSEKKITHWSDADKNGLSIIGAGTGVLCNKSQTASEKQKGRSSSNRKPPNTAITNKAKQDGKPASIRFQF